MFEIIKIPETRKPVLIGKNGATKKRIEKETRCSLDIRLDIKIEGEALDVLVAVKVCKAIGRGFTPKESLLLLDEEYDLFVLPVSGSEKRRHTKLSRIIGRQGTAKRMLQSYTGAKIAVQGKTISFIGTHEELDNAVRAAESLLSGSKHGTVYKSARKRKASKKRKSD